MFKHIAFTFKKWTEMLQSEKCIENFLDEEKSKAYRSGTQLSRMANGSKKG